MRLLKKKKRCPGDDITFSLLHLRKNYERDKKFHMHDSLLITLILRYYYYYYFVSFFFLFYVVRSISHVGFS